MSERNSVDRVDVAPPADGFGGRRQERMARRAARRADRRAGGLGWVAGLVLIVLGVLFLLQDAGIFTQFTNWWALFLLLPAVGTLSAALGAYRRNDGQWTAEVTGPFLAGLLFLVITVAFLLNLTATWFWPVLLIVVGILMLAGGLRNRAS